MAKNDKNVDLMLDNTNVLDVEVPKEDKKENEGKVDIIEVFSKDKKVKVKLNKTFSIYIGDRWHYFEKDKEISVTEPIKEILMSRGVLGVM